MNDLHDLMYRASDDDPNRGLDPTAMLRQGRRRLYRRRGVGAVGGMAAASLAIAGIAWLPGTTAGSQPDHQPPAVSGSSGDDTTELGEESSEGTVELPLPAADDEAGIRKACGRYAGRDFAGWQVLTADSGDDRLAAVLRSTNGRHMASCQLDGGKKDRENALGSNVVVATEAKLRAKMALGLNHYWIHPSFDMGCQRKPPGQWVADCLGVGWASGPEPAARIVVTDVTGKEHEISVVDHWYAFAGTVTNHAAVPEGGCPPAPNVCDDSPGELHFTVYAADGTVLAEYDEDEDLPLIT